MEGQLQEDSIIWFIVIYVETLEATLHWEDYISQLNLIM